MGWDGMDFVGSTNTLALWEGRRIRHVFGAGDDCFLPKDASWWSGKFLFVGHEFEVREDSVPTC